jgi:hypothetical protein
MRAVVVSRYAPGAGMLGGLEKRPFPASAEFVTAKPHDRAAITDTGNRAAQN